jgi:hypothetical protein
LLALSAKVEDGTVKSPTQAIEVPIGIREVVMIGLVEDGEFSGTVQIVGPLGIIRGASAMMGGRETVAEAPAPCWLGMHRAWVFADRHA